MWVADFPLAVTPLWQLTQAPVMELWSTRALAKLVVVWQSSQAAEVWMWVADFPLAVVPLWQLAQVPMTAAWSTRVTGLKRVVE
jgi:hypothetical protein